MREEYKIISFKTAKLAKEKGFLPSYMELEKLGAPIYKLGIGSYNSNGEYAMRNYYSQANTHYLAPDLLELQCWLRTEHNILVLVDYVYECTDTPYCYKIYKFVDENGRPKSWPIEGVHYEGDKEVVDIVGWRDYKISFKDYHTYFEAFDAGLQEALSMIEKDEINFKMPKENE